MIVKPWQYLWTYNCRFYLKELCQSTCDWSFSIHYIHHIANKHIFAMWILLKGEQHVLHRTESTCCSMQVKKTRRLTFSVLLLPLQKCLKFNVDAPIWLSKQRILCTLNQSLKDVLNYGLFQPAFNGKAGKFLDEERQLREYPFPSFAPVPYLEVGVDHECKIPMSVTIREDVSLHNT